MAHSPMMSVSARFLRRRGLAAATVFATMTTAAVFAQSGRPAATKAPIMLADQGSFAVGGSVLTNPGRFDPVNPTEAGQTVHGDHAYVMYQVPANARRLPLVMWHGGGQFSKTWETTPDGRDGYQNIFLRRGFTTYIMDQPRSGRASRTLVLAARQPPVGPFGEQAIFLRFRIGQWPDYFPGVQFPKGADALDQWWRQQVPNTANLDNEVFVASGVELFKKIGPAILLTHSASGVMGWHVATRNENVKAIVAYEPVGFLFPEGDVPAPIKTLDGDVTGVPVPLAAFEKLTKIPIQIVYGDNIPATPSTNPALDAWRGRLEMTRRFVQAVNAHGGHAELLHLPEVGVKGNTHFPFADLNNLQVADLLSDWLRKQKLDTRGTR
jgi:hypothetical protein